MKLSVNLIARGKYYRQGEEVPDELVSAELAAQHRHADATKAVPEAPDSSPSPADSEPTQAAGTHVKRGSSWKPIEHEDPLPGEQLYRRVGKAFVPVGKSET